MQLAYRELLGAHVIVTSITASIILACAFGLVGPIGFYTVENPVGRIARSLLYVALCYPAYFGCLALLFYFLRFRSPLEMLAAVTLMAPLVSFQCTAVIYTMETLPRPGTAAEARLGEVWLQVITASWIALYLCFYVLWQRTRLARRAGSPAADASSAAGRNTRPAGVDANEPAAATAREDAVGKPAAGSGGGPAAAAAADRSVAVERRPEPADARVRRSGELPIRRPLQPAPAAPGAPQPAAAGATAATPATGAEVQDSNLLKLLPGRLGTDLVYVKSEDHYLEVNTTVGSSLIKMRFSDAVAELGDRGMQVHRSYWVATRHVVRTARNGKRTMLRLTGDHEVPVSVTHLRAVRALLAR